MLETEWELISWFRWLDFLSQGDPHWLSEAGLYRHVCQPSFFLMLLPLRDIFKSLWIGGLWCQSRASWWGQLSDAVWMYAPWQEDESKGVCACRAQNLPAVFSNYFSNHLLWTGAGIAALCCVFTVCQALWWVIYTHFFHSDAVGQHASLSHPGKLRHREIKRFP